MISIYTYQEFRQEPTERTTSEKNLMKQRTRGQKFVSLPKRNEHPIFASLELKPFDVFFTG